MTVSAGEAKAGPYTGNDVTSSFAFAFKVFADGDIRVVETLIATGVESDLVLNTNYTISRNADQNADPGGTITYKVGGITTALPSTKKITIVGDFTYEQPTNIPNGGSFFASVVETAFDRLTMQIKQIKEAVGRAVLVDVSSSTLPSALMAELTADVAAAAASATAADASADAADASADAAAASALAAAASEAATSDKVSRTGDTMTGLLNLAASTDIASDATVDLTAATGNTTRITDATAVSAWTMNAGQWHMVIADGALPLTYHATTNKLNTNGENYTCTAGDRLLLHKDNSGIIQASVIPNASAVVAASQAEVEAGTEAELRSMSPLRVAQAIAALGGGGVTSGTVVDTSTGATSYTVTGIPSGAKFISFGYGGISTNGTSSVMIRVGPSGGVVNAGYAGALFDNTTATQPTDGFYIDNLGAAAAVRHGRGTLQLIDASTNTWSWRSEVLSSDSNRAERTASGTISLAGALERFQITANGTDTFDAGKLNYLILE